MSWYRTGTVTLENGSPNIIGTGTAWLAAKSEAGDAITLPDGRDYEIQAVGSDRSITVTSPYLGASVAGAPYQIKPIATAARLIALASQAGQLLQEFASVAQGAGVGKFAAGALVDNVLRPSLRGLIDDDTGINLPGGGVIEQVQNNVKTASYAADGTPSGLVWDKAPISTAAQDQLDVRLKRTVIEAQGDQATKAQIDAAVETITRVNLMAPEYVAKGLNNYGNLLGIRGRNSDTCAQLFFNYAEPTVFYRSGTVAGIKDVAFSQFANTTMLEAKADKAYRTTPAGTTNSAESATWRGIGVIAFGPSDPARIIVYGTGGYGDLDACSGETVIHMRGTNDSTGRGLEGHFYGHSKGNATISSVAVSRIDGTHWRVYVKASQYMALSAVCDTATSWVPEHVNTGSGAQPAGSRLLDSLNWWMVSGQAVMGLSAKGLDLRLGGLRQGPLAPRTAKKMVTGVMPAKGGTTAMEHGVSDNNIVGVQVECQYGSDGSWVGPNADGPNLPASHYRFRTWRGPVAISVGIDAGEGEALVGKPVRAWVEYIVE